MKKYSKIWANGTKKVDDDDEVIPWIASSKSSDQKKQKYLKIVYIIIVSFACPFCIENKGNLFANPRIGKSKNNVVLIGNT